jgi:tetratricopeptide (TPR) repeat protein
LYAELPLTPEAKKTSDSTISAALFEAGKTFIQEAEDCNEGTYSLERLRLLTPGFEKMNEVYFNLYYCYNKAGETAKAAAIKKLMSEKYPDDRYTQIVTTGKDPQSKSANSDATKTYEKIYDLFIEGNFKEAIAQKKAADSIYDNNYWTPQLLYIESVYYIKQREDSTAIGVLNNIVVTFPNTPIAAKAKTMIDVLGRRKQIEDELTKLNISRPAEVQNQRPIPQQDTTRLVAIPKRDLIDTATKIPPPKPVTTATKDSVSKAPVVTPPAATAFAMDTASAHYVVLVLNKVDPVFCNEAKNAFFRYNRETYYNKQFVSDLNEFDSDNKLLLISPFKNAREAIEYITKAKPLAATEIIPWLKGGKYEFIIISENNLGIIKANKNLTDYKTFINSRFPGKF